MGVQARYTKRLIFSMEPLMFNELKKESKKEKINVAAYLRKIIDNRKLKMDYLKFRDFEAEDIYHSFENPKKCRTLIRYLLDIGLLPEIMGECMDFLKKEDNKIYDI